MKKILVTFIILLLPLAPHVVIADKGSQGDQLSASELEYEKKINAVIVKEARIRAETNPGFRDLKPGIAKPDYKKYCNLRIGGDTCYGIQNIKFTGKYGKSHKVSSIGKNKFGVEILNKLILDMGPIVQSNGSILTIIEDVLSEKEESNIYLKMKKNLDAKYSLNYEYSERDRQLFNEGEKEYLLGVYSDGQVALIITREENVNSYNKNIWLYIEYRDVAKAKSFLEQNRPVTASSDDF